MNSMTDGRNPDLWQMMFEQTPVVLRWVMGVLTLGIFTLASIVYKWHREDMERVRQQQREDMEHTRRNINRVHERVDEVKDQIAANHQSLMQIIMYRTGQGGSDERN